MASQTLAQVSALCHCVQAPLSSGGVGAAAARTWAVFFLPLHKLLEVLGWVIGGFFTHLPSEQTVRVPC